ncbi:MAG: GIY-YIG nuclease family protein [Myxococcales bacterium]|nr:GIY-YIG nuclease family protein [Myxococcales bacterium]
MAAVPDDPWWVYLVECRDYSLYTGIAKDVGERICLHAENKGARYTRGRAPLRLVGAIGPVTHREALQLEAKARRWPRSRRRCYFLQSTSIF